MRYPHWFLTRFKKKMTSIVDILIIFKETCDGKVWKGNEELQNEFDQALIQQGIIDTDKEESKNVGGTLRTVIKQLKDYGFVFFESGTNVARLTLIGEALVRGEITFVEAMQIQMNRYQYPSAASWNNTGSVDREFSVHPFHFILRLLRDPRLKNKLTLEEIEYIVIHQAKSDTNKCLNDVAKQILNFRSTNEIEIPKGKKSRIYYDVAGAFLNQIAVLNFTDFTDKTLSIREGMEDKVDAFIKGRPAFIAHPELQARYLREYGKGKASEDSRDFSAPILEDQLIEDKIRHKFASLKMKLPIASITPEVITLISTELGLKESLVSSVLSKNIPKDSIEDFFYSYQELTNGMRKADDSFKEYTISIFEDIFGLEVIDTESDPDALDLIIESLDGWSGIVGMNARKKKNLITRTKLQNLAEKFISNYKENEDKNKPLEFVMFLSADFNPVINYQLDNISKATQLDASALTVDRMIDIARDYLKGDYSQDDVKKIFSAGYQGNVLNDED